MRSASALTLGSFFCLFFIFVLFGIFLFCIFDNKLPFFGSFAFGSFVFGNYCTSVTLATLADLWQQLCLYILVPTIPATTLAVILFISEFAITGRVRSLKFYLLLTISAKHHNRLSYLVDIGIIFFRVTDVGVDNQ